jgi:hypothetical protein
MCPLCGNGRCDTPGETCASCQQDCGSCAFCGNMRCESTMNETCENCPQDCGQCMQQLHNCGGALTCLFGCLGGGFDPTHIPFGCVANCRALTCPSSGIFFDDVSSCAIGAFLTGGCGAGGGITCVTSMCSSQIQRCLSDRTTCS